MKTMCLHHHKGYMMPTHAASFDSLSEVLEHFHNTKAI